MVDLATLTIGTRDAAGNWSARGVADMAQRSGLRHRRSERVLRVLGQAGMVYPVQRRERGTRGPGGFTADRHGKDWRSRNAVRKLTWTFWRSLGMEQAARREQKKAIKRLAAKKPRAAAVAQATVRRALKRKPSPRAASDDGMTTEQRKEFAVLCLQIRGKYPDMPAAEVRRRAREAVTLKQS